MSHNCSSTKVWESATVHGKLIASIQTKGKSMGHNSGKDYESSIHNIPNDRSLNIVNDETANYQTTCLENFSWWPSWSSWSKINKQSLCITLVSQINNFYIQWQCQNLCSPRSNSKLLSDNKSRTVIVINMVEKFTSPHSTSKKKTMAERLDSGGRL